MMRIFITLAFCLMCFFLNGQTFFCESEKEVFQNATFEIALVVENGKASGMIPPKVSGAKLVGGPSTSTNVSIINGKQSSTYKEIYTYLVESKQDITVGSATAIVNGKKMSSQPFTIKVKSSAELEKNLNGDFIFKLELSDKQVYIGQQILVSYVLYYANYIQIENILSESKYEGAIANRLENPQGKDKTITSKGKTYNSKVLHQVLLIPQRIGKLVIEPCIVNAYIAGKNSERSFFGYTDLQNFKLSSQIETLIVKNLPPSPAHFSGAVGKYTIEANSDKKKLTTDEAVSVFVTIQGNGDKSLIKNPTLTTNLETEIYDAKVIEENEKVIQGELIHLKKLEYLVVPKQKGSLDIQVAFNYFDTEENSYKDAKTQIISVSVSQGNSQENSKQDTSIVAKEPKTNKAIYLIVFALLTIIAFLGVRKYTAEKAAKIDPIIRNQNLASKKIVKHLQYAKSKLDKGNEKEFYSVLSASLNEYIFLKFNIATDQQNKDYIQTTIKDLHNAELAERYVALMNACESAVYGFGLQKPAMEYYEEARSILEGLEKK